MKDEFTLRAGESTAASFDQAKRDEISWDKSKPWETIVEMEVYTEHLRLVGRRTRVSQFISDIPSCC
jgi:hypothetical protein